MRFQICLELLGLLGSTFAVARCEPDMCRFGDVCCGDGRVQAGEACDDGNLHDGDYCASDCQRVTGHCGDGIVQRSLEVCDEGSANSDAWHANKRCRRDCRGHAPHCGDAEIQQEDGESCDDGNPSVTCSEACRVRMRVSAGHRHTCVLLDDGSVTCFGSDTVGQLGDGRVDTAYGPTVRNLDGYVRTVAAGAFHTCVVLADGSLRCFGNSDNGQGGGTATPGLGLTNHGPAEVAGWDKHATWVGAGGYHNCVLTRTRRLFCWGDGDRGQLGRGHASSAELSPVEVPMETDVQEFAVGKYTTCAATVRGALLCWGANDSGQVGDGDGDGTDLTTPTPVVGLQERVLYVSLGGEHGCASLEGGSVLCWGANTFGQVGNGDDTADPILSPVSVVGLPRSAVSTSCGAHHSCALLDDGSVWCWGRNSHGQLGNGDEKGENKPHAVPVVGLQGAATWIAAGGHHTCAIVLNAVVCWGNNEDGQLGSADVTMSPVPVAATVGS